MPRFSSSTLLGLSVALACTSSLADTVWLKNGDRLSGTIRFFDGKKLLLQTDYGGSIALDWKKVATLESEQNLLIKHSQAAGEQTKSLQAGEAGTVVLNNGSEPKTVELASIDQIMKPKPLVTDFTWKGNIDLGLDYKRGERDSDDYDVGAKVQARHGAWRHEGSAEYNRELKNDVVSTDNWSAEYALDRFLGEKLFWQGRFEYKADRIEEIERQRTLGTGPGYQFWDDELGAFSMTSLVNRTDYRYSDGGTDRFYALSLKWAYNRYLVGKSVEMFTNGELGRPLNGAADYSLDYELGLRYKVTDWASLNIKAERDIVSGASGDLDETRYTMGFGIGW